MWFFICESERERDDIDARSRDFILRRHVVLCGVRLDVGCVSRRLNVVRRVVVFSQFYEVRVMTIVFMVICS